MDFLEKDLEDILYNSNRKNIFDRGLSHFCHHLLFRQVRIEGYGIVDLIGVMYSQEEKTIRITVYELKNKKLQSETFWQLLRYLKGIKHVIKSSFDLRNHFVEITGVMVGREIDDSNDFCFLPTLNSKIHIYTYEYNIDGITFRYGYDSYFKTAYNKFDLSQTGFDKKELARYLIEKNIITPTVECQESEA